MHRINNNQNVDFLTGFKYENNQEGQKDKRRQKDDGSFRDKEGVDFQVQYLSQQKTKQQITSIDEHPDSVFDFRVEKEVDLLKCILSVESYRELESKSEKRRHAEEYYYKKKRDQKQIFLEDLRLFKSHPLYRVKEKQFDEKLEQVFDQEEWDTYHDIKSKYNKGKINEHKFLRDFLGLCGEYIGFRLFQLYLRTIQNEATQTKLDLAYLREVSKLPKKIPNLVNTVETYSEFFKKFREEIEQNISHRIETKRLSMKKRIKMERSRIVQLIEILRRIRTHEMAKLKFAINFGLSSEGMDFVLNKIYFSSLDKLQDKINRIPTQDFLKLYLYVSICDDMISGKYTRKDMNQISTLIFKDFFAKRPEIVETYCKKYRTHISDDDSDQERRNNLRKNLDYRIPINTIKNFPTLPGLPPRSDPLPEEQKLEPEKPNEDISRLKEPTEAKPKKEDDDAKKKRDDSPPVPPKEEEAFIVLNKKQSPQKNKQDHKGKKHEQQSPELQIRSQEKAAQDKAAQEKAAQDKAAQDKAAQEKAK